MICTFLFIHKRVIVLPKGKYTLDYQDWMNAQNYIQSYIKNKFHDRLTVQELQAYLPTSHSSVFYYSDMPLHHVSKMDEVSVPLKLSLNPNWGNSRTHNPCKHMTSWFVTSFKKAK